MIQAGITTEWLLEGFRYDLGATCAPQTLAYYCGHLQRFLRWAKAAGVPEEAHLIDKRHIQAFSYHLFEETETVVGGNGSHRKIKRSQRSRWPYYRSLKRFFGWAMKEGYLSRSPMEGVELRRLKDRPIEPWRPEQIDRMFQVLNHDWKVARTPRQRMLAALTVEDVDLERQRALVRKGKMGKGRWVGFGPHTRKSLWRYMGLRQALAEGNVLKHVFIVPQGGQGRTTQSDIILTGNHIWMIGIKKVIAGQLIDFHDKAGLTMPQQVKDALPQVIGRASTAEFKDAPQPLPIHITVGAPTIGRFPREPQIPCIVEVLNIFYRTY